MTASKCGVASAPGPIEHTLGTTPGFVYLAAAGQRCCADPVHFVVTGCDETSISFRTYPADWSGRVYWHAQEGQPIVDVA